MEKKEVDLKYLKNLYPILNKVGKKQNIPPDEGGFIIGEFFKSLFTALTDPRLYRIRIPMFGLLRPKITFINKSLKASLRFHKLGGSTRDYIIARFKRLWGIKQRLIAEKKGINTWDTWKRKEVKQEYQELVENEHRQKIRSKDEVLRREEGKIASLPWIKDKSNKPIYIFSAIQKGLSEENRKHKKSRKSE